MKEKIFLIVLIILPCLFLSCENGEQRFDASGSFEADETMISAEVSGVLRSFDIVEGQELLPGQKVGWIDSTQTYLKKKQIEAQIQALLSRRPDISVQLGALDNQLEKAKLEKKRIEKLLEKDAATTKQLDDINSQIRTLESQIRAKRSSLNITSDGISMDANMLQIQVEQLEDLLKKYSIVNPVKGVVLDRYALPHEMAGPGKPLYKIADLDHLFLRVYISGDQLAEIKLDQEVKVFTDDGSGNMKEGKGKVSWISEKAEFTPKTIQTKNERANLVYAIKVRLDNDGSYKIGMYGEVVF